MRGPSHLAALETFVDLINIKAYVEYNSTNNTQRDRGDNFVFLSCGVTSAAHTDQPVSAANCSVSATGPRVVSGKYACGRTQLNKTEKKSLRR